MRLTRALAAGFSSVVLTLAGGCDDGPSTKPAASSSQAAPKASTEPVVSAPPPASAPAPPPKPEKLVVIAGGDVNLGREAGQKILKDPEYNPFVNLAPLLKSADLNFVNLESQLSDQGGETQSPRNRLIFTGPPGGGSVLANAGIDLVSIANNHAWDYRKSAFLETLDNLEKAGVRYAGGSREAGAQYKPTILKLKGFSIAFFAVTHIWNQGPFEKHPGREFVAWARYDLLHEELKRAKREHDLVMLSYHGGGEYIDVPMIPTREFVEAVMDAGVDVLFGHHPHVVHGVYWRDGRPAFYSLGNLVFNQHRYYPWTGTGFLAKVTLTRDGPEKVEACPFHILGHTPTLFEGKAKEPLERAFRRRLKIVSITVGGTGVGEPGEYSCMLLTPPEPKPAKADTPAADTAPG